MDDHRKSVCDHLDAVRRYARFIGRDPAYADDLVQECLSRVLSRPHLWCDVKDARAYLMTILRNVHVDESLRRWREGETVPLESAAPSLASGPTQYARMLLRDVARSLRLLPEPRRRIVLLVAVEGMSYQEAAATLGIPIGTVMSRLSRARDSLRQLLEDDTAAAADCEFCKPPAAE
jgi:RNA polymerase sigma-70 factor (ECF subfamily)